MSQSRPEQLQTTTRVDEAHHDPVHVHIIDGERGVNVKEPVLLIALSTIPGLFRTWPHFFL